MLDLAIRGARVFDGSGAPPSTTDIGIKDGRIAFIGQNPSARETLDLDGLCLAPGFIDVHAHSEFSLLACPKAEGKVHQGVTSEINGNCGLSAAPLMGECIDRREADLREFEIKERWNTLGEYYAILSSRRPNLNFFTLAGHGNIRASVMGYTDRKPTPDEMARMGALLRDCLNDGAIGLSTGLIYPPGIYSSHEEISALAALGRGREGFVYASHMRSEGDGLLEAIEETINIGRSAGVPVHISHIKTSNRANWHKIDKAIALIDNARAEGIRVTCDRYPYTAGSTDLDASLPAFMFEGGNEAELKRLQSPDVRAKLLATMPSDDETWDSVIVSETGSEKNAWAVGLSVSQIGRRTGKPPLETMFDLLVEERLRVGAIFFSMSPQNLERFLSLPYAMIGSDSSVRCTSGPTRRGRPHPRGFGSFALFISEFAPALRNPLGDFEDAALAEGIRKITSLPAATFGLKDRGIIRQGAWADLVAFHPSGFRAKSSYEEPFLLAEGVEHVLLAGRAVLSNGRLV